jgi:methylated-DNA-[protein]-cysteine S-methyltransferase
MLYFYSYKTVLGSLWIYAGDSNITNVSFEKIQIDSVEKETELIKMAYCQLNEYFKGMRDKFNLPLKPDGTQFQKSVWEALLKIPYGQTRSYKQIAEEVGAARAARAVGMANNKNPIAIIIPCHRVIGAGGKLTGYAGGLDKKELLLKLEKRFRK